MQCLASHLVKLSEEMERRRRWSEQDDKPLNTAELLEEEEPGQEVMGVGKYFVPFQALQEEAKLKVCSDRSTGEQLSCCVYDLEFFRARMVLFSIDDMKGVHPIREVLQSKTHAFVFSNITYGDLHQYLSAKGSLSEVEAASLSPTKEKK